MHNPDKLSIRTLERYARYYQAALDLEAAGNQNISSTDLSREVLVNPNTVKKDISTLPLRGNTRRGYPIHDFIRVLSLQLGSSRITQSILIGAGNLGTAISSYSAFRNYGLEIIAVFDNAPERIGTMAGRHRVLPPAELNYIIEIFKVKMAIITVPAAAAQNAAEQLYRLGIRHFWNFAPIHLKLPKDCLVTNENLAASYLVLSSRIQEWEQNQPGK